MAMDYEGAVEGYGIWMSCKELDGIAIDDTGRPLEGY